MGLGLYKRPAVILPHSTSECRSLEEHLVRNSPPPKSPKLRGRSILGFPSAYECLRFARPTKSPSIGGFRGLLRKSYLQKDLCCRLEMFQDGRLIIFLGFNSYQTLHHFLVLEEHHRRRPGHARSFSHLRLGFNVDINSMKLTLKL